MSRHSGNGPKGLEGLSEIGKRLADLADHMKTAFEEGVEDGSHAPRGSSSQRTFTINTPRGPLTGVAGYSISMGGLSPKDETPFDAEYKKTKSEPADAPETAPNPTQEPLVDVFVEETEILITAELAGVQMDDVTVALADMHLTIETRQEGERARLQLTHPVAPESMKTSLRNGILEITLTRILEDRT